MSVAIVNYLSACEYVRPQVLIKTVTSITVPELISATDIFFRKATIIGNKSARVGNTGIVYIGVAGTNDVQAFAIASGAVAYLNAPVGCRMSFKDFWIDAATAADGVVIMYT
jgi:hypothetical protein